VSTYFDKKQEGWVILEFDDNCFEDKDSVFGIANVHSGMCDLSVGYFLSENSLTVLLPEFCYYCQKSDICSRLFGEQIIKKLNDKDKGKVSYLLK
jgi:hypothetical protein